MKRFFGVTLAFALVLATAAVAVQLFDDRETFVPGPDATAEAFIREVLTKRWDRARTYLAEPDAIPTSELLKLKEKLGEVQNVDAEVREQHLTRAVAEVTLKEHTLRVPLVWEEEAWKVSALP